MAVERIAYVVGVHLQQCAVARPTGGDQHVVDRPWQAVEEAGERLGVVGVKRGDAPCSDLPRRLLEPVPVSPGENHLGALGACPPGGLEPDPGAATDQDDGLTAQLGFSLRGGRCGAGCHGSFGGSV